MLVSPFEAELTSTIGPGSRNRRIFDTGKSFFVKALITLSVLRPSGRHKACFIANDGLLAMP